jgi:hypothetical protein
LRRMGAYRGSHPELSVSQAVSVAAHEVGAARSLRLLLRLALVVFKISRGLAAAGG